MNLGHATTRANEFQGLDLTETEFRDLFNEARVRFALRSKYPRKLAEIGPTVAQQASYDWPTDILLPLRLQVGGREWASADPAAVADFKQGLVTLNEQGVWYEKPDEAGARKLFLHPIPEEESTLVLEWVYAPAPLTKSSESPSELPEPFQDGLLYEAAAIAFEGSEDNVEFATYYAQKAEARMRELMAYDNMRRSGNGVFTMPIVGVTAR